MRHLLPDVRANRQPNKAADFKSDGNPDACPDGPANRPAHPGSNGHPDRSTEHV